MNTEEILRAFRRFRDENPEHPEAHYALGVVLLDHSRAGGGAHALKQARSALRRAAELGAGDARFHAMLGHALDWDEATAAEATAALAAAHRLEPGNLLFETYWITLLADSAPADVAMTAIDAAARRQGVDLEAVHRELAAAKLPVDPPTLVMNAFVRARTHFRSHFMDELERLLGQAGPESAARQQRALTEQSRAQQDGLAATLDPAEVPEALRALTPLAARFGVDDAASRSLALSRLTDEEKDTLIGRVEPHAAAINDWLDGYPGEAMPAEAAAFLYLLLALEELRG